MSLTEQLLDDDRRYLWHPFTQMLGWADEDAPVITEAKGTTLIDSEGRRYIDGVSSLWCNVHGHRHPRIDTAIRAQLNRVAHSTLLGLTHPGAVQLAKRLVEITPAGLERVFYSDSGSTAVEVALKMAFQYWHLENGNSSRDTFICLEDSYHGDTIGSVSVGGIDLFHKTYSKLLFSSLKVRAGDIEAIEQLMTKNSSRIAAVIVEPLVQGAGGILLQPPGYLSELRALCDQHEVLLICDEVATGFGRTGTMFACEQENVAPDFLCLAKGLTGGYLPLAATLTSERVYKAFLGQYDEFKTFFHGHTYTGNPLACAAALATIEIFGQEQTLEQLQPKIAFLSDLLKPVEELESVTEVRQCGFMVGIELKADPKLRTGHQVTLKAREDGAIIRPLGDVIVLMPPLSISSRELKKLVQITAESIKSVSGTKETVEA